MYIETALIKIAVIPAYEPDEMLIEVASEASASGFEVVVVDDGSVSGNSVKSGKVPREKYDRIFGDVMSFAHVIRYPENRGKGYAMKQAFAYIKEEYKCEDSYAVVVIDSDGQHRIVDAARLVEHAAVHPGTLVLGSRKQGPDSPIRSRIGNGITRNVFRLLSGVSIYDTQTGLRAFSKKLMDRMLSVPGDRYEYEMNMLMDFAREQVPMVELPIETIYIDNNAGSHFNPLKDSIRIYRELFRFSLSGFAGFLIDFAIFGCIVELFGKTASVMLCANVFARLISATANYSINRNFVFAGTDNEYIETEKKNKESVANSAGKYILLAVTILALNTTLLCAVTKFIPVNPMIAKVCIEILMFFVNFTLQRRFVFASSGKGVEQTKVFAQPMRVEAKQTGEDRESVKGSHSPFQDYGVA